MASRIETYEKVCTEVGDVKQGYLFHLGKVGRVYWGILVSGVFIFKSEVVAVLKLSAAILQMTLLTYFVVVIVFSQHSYIRRW